MTDEAYVAWLDEVLVFYRSLGFFERGEFAGRSITDCRRLLSELHNGWLPRSFHEPKPNIYYRDLFHLEMHLVQQDLSRMWTTDVENVYFGCPFYKPLVETLRYLSNYSFDPQNVVENWEALDEHWRFIVHVSFDLENKPHHIWIPAHGDFAHHGIFGAINQLASPAAQPFCIFHSDQTWHVTCQSEADAEAMRTRGWGGGVQNDVGQVVMYPDIANRTSPNVLTGKPPRHEWECHWTRFAYFQRGILRAADGDEEGALNDWHAAQMHGMSDVFERVGRHFS